MDMRLIFIFLLFSPIFISIGAGGNVVFDRTGLTELVYRGTFPISIVIVIFFAIRNYKKIFIDKVFFLFVVLLKLLRTL